MQRPLGFTLIEIMIAVAVIAILTVIAYPSYETYLRRAYRAQAQQFLMDLAQREEQFLLDMRSYTTTLGTGGLAMTVPTDVATRYQAPVIALPSATPPTYRITITPIVGGRQAVDGALVINNLQQTWRETDGNNAFDANRDCRWEETSCIPS